MPHPNGTAIVIESENMIVQMSVSENNFINVLFPFFLSATDTTNVLLDANKTTMMEGSLTSPLS